MPEVNMKTDLNPPLPPLSCKVCGRDLIGREPDNGLCGYCEMGYTKAEGDRIEWLTLAEGWKDKGKL